ncbi:hypothetical protein [Neptunomonas phycophila]
MVNYKRNKFQEYMYFTMQIAGLIGFMLLIGVDWVHFFEGAS